MAKPRKNAFNRILIDAIFSTPFIVLGPTARSRRSAAKKWLAVLVRAR